VLRLQRSKVVMGRLKGGRCVLLGSCFKVQKSQKSNELFCFSVKEVGREAVLTQGILCLMIILLVKFTLCLLSLVMWYSTF
jgi:hypothetical protein